MATSQDILKGTKSHLPQTRADKVIHVKIRLFRRANILENLDLSIHTDGQKTALRESDGRWRRMKIQFLDRLIFSQIPNLDTPVLSWWRDQKKTKPVSISYSLLKKVQETTNQWNKKREQNMNHLRWPYISPWYPRPRHAPRCGGIRIWPVVPERWGTISWPFHCCGPGGPPRWRDSSSAQRGDRIWC